MESVEQKPAQTLEIVKFIDLPAVVQNSIDELRTSRKRKQLYKLIGRVGKCEDLTEKIWTQYNELTSQVRSFFGNKYTHIAVLKSGDLVLSTNDKKQGETYEAAYQLRVPF